MEIELPYGRGICKFNLENDASIFNAPPVQGLKDPGDSLLQALNHPIDSPPLREKIKKGKVVIVVSDKTRLVCYPLFLPNLLNYLNKAGVKDQEITLIIGRGSHRGHTSEDVRSLFGDEVLRRVEIVEHDCHDKPGMVEVGKTRYENRVILNRRVVEAENVILTGSIRFHPYSGFSGGRKSVLPGVAAFETIQNNHKMNLSFSQSRIGILEGNAIHEEMLDAAELLNPCFLINMICNDSHEIVTFFTGHWRKAHEEGCQLARAIFSPKVRGRADFAITSVGGYPGDINFHQSLKAVENTAITVKDGGVMLLLAECQNGLGPEEFLQWFDMRDIKRVRELLKKEFSISGYVALCLMETAKRIRIVLVSSLPSEMVRKTGVIATNTVEDGLRYALQQLPVQFHTYVFPLGGSHVPMLID